MFIPLQGLYSHYFVIIMRREIGKRKSGYGREKGPEASPISRGDSCFQKKTNFWPGFQFPKVVIFGLNLDSVFRVNLAWI